MYLEAEIVFGVLYRKGGTPQKGGYFGFPPLAIPSMNRYALCIRAAIMYPQVRRRWNQVHLRCYVHVLFYGSKDYTHIITQYICYVGFSGRIVFCVIRGLHEVLSVNVPITHINCLGMNFPIAWTFVTMICYTKALFLNYLCNRSGLTVSHIAHHSSQPLRATPSWGERDVCLQTAIYLAQ